MPSRTSSANSAEALASILGRSPSVGGVLYGRMGGRRAQLLSAVGRYGRGPVAIHERWRDRVPARDAPAEPLPGCHCDQSGGRVVDLHNGDVGYIGVSRDYVWVATQWLPCAYRPQHTSSRGDRSGGAIRLGCQAWMPSGRLNSSLGPWRASTRRRRRPPSSWNSAANPDSLAIFEDSVWVAQHRGDLITRLDASTGSVLAKVEVGPEGFGGPHGIGADRFGVWVGIPRPESRSVVRIDPATNAVVATIKTESSACGGIALHPEGVWVSELLRRPLRHPDRSAHQRPRGGDRHRRQQRPRAHG